MVEELRLVERVFLMLKWDERVYELGNYPSHL